MSAIAFRARVAASQASATSRVASPSGPPRRATTPSIRSALWQTARTVTSVSATVPTSPS